MAKTMAQGEGLTARQKQFLAVVLQEPYILKKFYLTGRTALSLWYLHHRESNDLDFFSFASEVNSKWITGWLTHHQGVLGYDKVSHIDQLGFHFFNFAYPNKEILRVDFSFFPSERIEKGLIWKGLTIDSLYDIAVNKLQTISQRPREKDYVDLYLIMKKTGWSFSQLRQDAQIKFGIHVEPVYLASCLLRINEFSNWPKMLVALNRQEMKNFYVKLAGELKQEVFT